MGKRVVPPVGRFGGVGEIRKRLRGSQIIYDNRDGLATEMLGIAKAKITDIFDWNGQKLELKDAKDIPDHALAAIKKIKISLFDSSRAPSDLPFIIYLSFISAKATLL